jgi:predicted small integral membrane protein
MSSTFQSCRDRAGCREVRPALVGADAHCAGGARTAGSNPAGVTVARARSLTLDVRALYWLLFWVEEMSCVGDWFTTWASESR